MALMIQNHTCNKWFMLMNQLYDGISWEFYKKEIILDKSILLSKSSIKTFISLMISFYIHILSSGGIFENWFRSSSRACVQACAQRVFTCSNGGSFSTRVKAAQSFIQSIEVENSRPNPSISGKGSGADWFHVASKITSNCGQKGINVGRSAIIAQESEGIGYATSVSGRSGGISIASGGRIFVSSVIGSMVGTIAHYCFGANCNISLWRFDG